MTTKYNDFEERTKYTLTDTAEINMSAFITIGIINSIVFIINLIIRKGNNIYGITINSNEVDY